MIPKIFLIRFKTDLMANVPAVNQYPASLTPACRMMKADK
jgi:hypothetical protein